MHVLITGGAGLIGSHTADTLLARGHRVRILDNLSLPTHAGEPELPARAEFLRGDVGRPDDCHEALRGVDAVFHLAALGGVAAEPRRYIDVNAAGTAVLLDAIRARREPLRKLIVASSVAVYGEGVYSCAAHGSFHAATRPLAQLERSEWDVRCPTCGAAGSAASIDERTPAAPYGAHAVSKFAQERLALAFGAEAGVSVTAMRYFLAYGPRQSLTNPYTGVCSIFLSRLLNDLPPMLYEDGRQTRDFVYVGDVAAANALVLEHDGAAGRVFNAGTGRGHALADVAERLARGVDKPVHAHTLGRFRPGDARHLVADISDLAALGYRPAVTLEEGLARTCEWARSHGRVLDVFGPAEQALQRSGVVRGRGVHRGAPPAPAPAMGTGSLSVIIPAYNESGNLPALIPYICDEMARMLPDFEVLIVNDGSHDGTGQIADTMALADARIRVIHHPFNLGVGAAQKTGFSHARGEWVVVVPADHQFDVRDLRKYLALRECHDVVGGRRIDRQDPVSRCFVSWLFNRSMRFLYDVKLRDLNWVKMWRRSLFDRIKIQSAGFAGDAEMVIKAQRLGMRIVEVDVPHYPRTWGVPVQIRFRTVFRTAIELLKLRKPLKAVKAQPVPVRETAEAGS